MPPSKYIDARIPAVITKMTPLGRKTLLEPYGQIDEEKLAIAEKYVSFIANKAALKMMSTYQQDATISLAYDVGLPIFNVSRCWSAINKKLDFVDAAEKALNLNQIKGVVQDDLTARRKIQSEWLLKKKRKLPTKNPFAIKPPTPPPPPEPTPLGEDDEAFLDAIFDTK